MYEASDVIVYSSLLIGALLAIALVKKEPSDSLKLFLFWGMVIPITLTTLYLAIGTVVKNEKSATGGPVHWHADFEISACGQPVDLKNPSGISNRIGTTVLHEHGDDRIHVEGIVNKLSDVKLAKFFEVIGGKMEKNVIHIPTDDGQLVIPNGMECPDGNRGTWQVFRYKTSGKTVIQEKLADFPNHVLAPYSQIPPGDCIIMEFTGQVKDKTETICNFYDIAIKQGELEYQQ
ncbi:MAG: hypothetical protein A3C85_03580 [Candidatus Doudnabacteria bacterium RIFCSPHIGHO2_02_FULL_48_21]|uniref:Uncharacterized protein n=1 Tax=Candidatus Doudnabacteria bacterium RIFCSPLOWO2_02_FULL_48_13 TaxID=1817845 RepID=A0A1F5QCD6_9BACT|nr:MAG: hypothetical protein A3K05_02000 [Candidatus Doudnabacteria bacterium RIFCSPHIGHO2_01_48_18]OGE77549.1 MAG: hypothetical protein A2668_03820 [Candidatus Doudnabacteria bacterium RIFCSPHIGHO2_01_FULL_48_180]OGE93690.1 MAG: hypothetical protein A3C85_03580 [Candidatus Doudnabacteria bacterium RIFCSPHIGHO2_02_FULL_48_21]OGE97340.1 MAG: hypothetical protein A3A83_03910 [Candidatus Doudnabacteria bacterium RIFCSPLOWO2_01_FULL_48_57]OGE99787.1 MAG: hypothetical protein A3J05_00760 [Candidatus